MCRKRVQIKLFVAGLLLALTLTADSFAQSPAGPSDGLESITLKVQTNNLTDHEILSRAEERAETLRTRMLGIQVQEMHLQASLEELDFRLSPEGIRIALAFVGSVRPMDEWRYALRVSLEKQKASVTKLLDIVVASRERLEAAILQADTHVERLRQRLTTQQATLEK